MKSIKIIYFPVQKEIKGNETADELPNIAAKISKTVELTYSILTSDIKTKNSKLSFKKWQRRWNNSSNSVYKDLVPILCIKSLKQRLSDLKLACRGSARKMPKKWTCDAKRPK